MKKQELIQEYIALEDHVETLEKKLKDVKKRERELAGSDDDTEIKPGEMRMDPETAEKCRLLQAEINRLIEENNELKTENRRLSTSEADAELTSADSESDSDSSLTSTSTSDSSDESDSSDSSSDESSSDRTSHTSYTTPASSVHMKTPTSFPSTPARTPYYENEYLEEDYSNSKSPLLLGAMRISTPPYLTSPLHPNNNASPRAPI